jgi:UDP-N-acetylglucosamine 2-epimerase (non-hydrolysing)
VKTVVIVAGTRPEAIKLVPVYQELGRSSSLQPLWLSTAQHRDMLDQALDAFGVAADVDLDVMQPEQTLTALTARVLTDVGRCLAELTPAAVLVQGDTATVLATAIAAFYAHLPVGHVEAGLRTYEDTPWPEEMNRRLVDPISRWCFAPTERAVANLRAERIPAARITLTGNTGIDALRLMQAELAASPPDRRALARRCGIPSEFAERFLGRAESRWILVTGHRRESFEGGFERICAAIAAAAAELPDVGFLYPVHLNPKVREPVHRALGGRRGITLIEPVGYADFVWLMNGCTLLLSDSGGVQEEAPSLGKPVLVLRDVTERPEGVEAGTCRLVGTDPARILGELRLLLGDAAEYRRRSALRNPYGDGHASERIRAVLERDLA